MRKIISITQVSLDGVMQGPGGPEEDPSDGFTHGGWAMRYADEAAGRIIGEIIAGEFDLLLGRRTYEIWARYWPHHTDNPIGAAFDKATKHVVTRTLAADRLEWKKSQRIDGEAGLRGLKASDGPALHVWGSSLLLQTLIAADLIDEYRVWIFPIVLGKGKRLFEPGAPSRDLTLVETMTTSSGVVCNAYRPSGVVK